VACATVPQSDGSWKVVRNVNYCYIAIWYLSGKDVHHFQPSASGAVTRLGRHVQVAGQSLSRRGLKRKKTCVSSSTIPTRSGKHSWHRRNGSGPGYPQWKCGPRPRRSRCSRRPPSSGVRHSGRRTRTSSVSTAHAGFRWVRGRLEEVDADPHLRGPRRPEHAASAHPDPRVVPDGRSRHRRGRAGRATPDPPTLRASRWPLSRSRPQGGRGSLGVRLVAERRHGEVGNYG